jgi:hypothetical protein
MSALLICGLLYTLVALVVMLATLPGWCAGSTDPFDFYVGFFAAILSGVMWPIGAIYWAMGRPHG